MPVYIFQNEMTGEVKEVVQSIHDKHEYSEGGVQWKRVFTPPQVGNTIKIDPYNPRDFVEKTGSQKGTMGDLWDRSKELSEKRKDKEGVDPVQQKYFDNYAKQRKGKRHHLDPKRSSK